MKNKLRMFLCAVLSTSLLLSAPVLIQAADAQETTEDTETKQDLAGLKYDHSLELQYADQFSVDYYEDGYALITIEGDGQFLLVPDGKEAPDGLDSDIAVIRQPLQNIYLVATSAMDLSVRWTDLTASVFPEQMQMAGILTRQKRLWKMAVFLLQENTVHRIRN